MVLLHEVPMNAASREILKFCCKKVLGFYSYTVLLMSLQTLYRSVEPASNRPISITIDARIRMRHVFYCSS